VLIEIIDSGISLNELIKAEEIAKSWFLSIGR
jgi:hypothetical protein